LKLFDVPLDRLAQPAAVAPRILDRLLEVPVQGTVRRADFLAHILAERRQRILRGIERLVETLDRGRLLGGRTLSRGAATAAGSGLLRRGHGSLSWIVVAAGRAYARSLLP
jgi:hypothetical protein